MIPIGLELYSVRNELAKDMPGTVKKVGEMGYKGVEFFGGIRYTAEEVNKAVKDAGVVLCGWHTPIDLLSDEQIEKTIEFNLAVGNRYIIVPALPGEMTGSIAAWKEMAQKFNRISERLAEHGLRLGFHNHAVEFQPMEGQQPWDVFFENCAPEIVMQLDNGNALSGNGDVLAALRKFPGRAETVHLKPYSLKTGFDAMIGQDDVPWAEFFKLCEETGNTKWYVVEYEEEKGCPLENVERCLKALQEMGKA